MAPNVVGIDFGTTNSVVALLGPDGQVTTRRFATGDVFRSVLCFWIGGAGGRSLLHAAGPDGIEAYLDDPLESRLIMSMKTYLAQRSFTRTQVHGRPFTLEAMVALFLRALLDGVDLAGARIVAGRPVRFAGELADDTLGEARLRESYRAAGVGEVEVAFEPEAAGYRFARTLDGPATVLIGDFGGGTSDFSVLRFAPGTARPVAALATTGVGVAGDTFDFRIIDRVISPLLGKGSTYRVMRAELPVPIEYYNGFARWHRLSLMRAPKTLREIGEVMRGAAEPEKLARLLRVIEAEQGYELYQAVSATKAALSMADRALLRFDGGTFQVEAEIARLDFEAWIAPDLAAMSDAVDRALALAEVAGVDRVFLTGGTSYVPAVRRLFEDRFGAERVSGGGEFVSVAEGLALIGRDRAGGEARGSAMPPPT